MCPSKNDVNNKKRGGTVAGWLLGPKIISIYYRSTLLEAKNRSDDSIPNQENWVLWIFLDFLSSRLFNRRYQWIKRFIFDVSVPSGVLFTGLNKHVVSLTSFD